MTTQKDLEIRIQDAAQAVRIAESLERSLITRYIEAFGAWKVGDKVTVHREGGKTVKGGRVWQITLSGSFEFTYKVEKPHGYRQNQVPIYKGDKLIHAHPLEV